METIVEKSKEQITFSLTTVLKIVGAVAGLCMVYYTSQVSAAKDFAKDRVNLAALNEAVVNLKDAIGDIKKGQSDTNILLYNLSKDRGYDPQKILSTKTP